MRAVRELDAITLSKWVHHTREDGMCVLEAAAWFAGELHTADPACVCRVLGRYVMRLNDDMADAKRQLLVPIIPQLVHTRGSYAVSVGRAEFLARAAVTRFAPVALEAAGMTEEAAKLRGMTGADMHALEDAAHATAYTYAVSAHAAASAAASANAYTAHAAYAYTYAASAAAESAKAAAAGDLWDDALEVLREAILIK